jgi:hypothetical protein
MQAISKGISSSTFLAENFRHNKAFPNLFPQAGLHLRYAFFDLGSREILVAVVDRFELAAVDGEGMAEQIELPAKRNKLHAGRADGGAVVAAEIGDGFEIRRQSAGQLNQLNVALTLPFEPAARLDTV